MKSYALTLHVYEEFGLKPLIRIIRLQPKVEALIFFSQPPTNDALIYLHGSGGFGKGATGAFEYEDFSSLLLRGELTLPMNFVALCALDEGGYTSDVVENLIVELKALFQWQAVHLAGYSRGGQLVYQLSQYAKTIQSATVINAHAPSTDWSPMCPTHIVYSANDQRVDNTDVLTMIKRQQAKVTATEWAGDHYAIAEIARSGLIPGWIAQLTTAGQ